jgi:hypothetical protein
MPENPYQPPREVGTEPPPRNPIPAKYALIGFLVGWSVFPAMWLYSVSQQGTFAGPVYELFIVAGFSLTFGTGIGIVVSAVLLILIKVVDWVL